MKKDNIIFIKHILQSIEKIEEFTSGFSKKQFLDSVLVQDAVLRRIEILGEASKNISGDFIAKHKDIPWSEMSKTRDILIHKYFGVDLGLTWTIIITELPKLKKQIISILNNS